MPRIALVRTGIILYSGEAILPEEQISLAPVYEAGTGCFFMTKGYDSDACMSSDLVVAKGAMTYCSAIARDNLERLTTLPASLNTIDALHIPQGDAMTLIEIGTAAQKFTKLDSCRDIKTELDKADLGAIADMYLFKAAKAKLKLHKTGRLGKWL